MKLELPSEKLHALTVNIVDTGDGVVIKRGRLQLKIAGEDAAEVVVRILGSAQRGATREQLIGQFAEPEQEMIEALVDHLIGRRILVSEDNARPPEAPREEQLDIFYWHFGMQTKSVRQQLNAKRIRILGVNYVSRQLAAGLRASGGDEFEVLDTPLLRNEALFDESGDLRHEVWGDARWSALENDLDPESLDVLVATSDTGAIEQLRVWNEFAVLHNLHFFPVLLQDLVGYVGPLVIPGQTPCFECVRLRQNAHLMDYRSRRSVESAFVQEQAVGGFHPSMASMLGDVAALELTKVYGLGNNLARYGTLIEVNLLGSEMKPHRVLKLPRCPVCSRLTRTPSTAFTRSMLGGGPQ